MEPDHGEKGFFVLDGPGDEGEGLVHYHAGCAPGEGFGEGLSVVPEESAHVPPACRLAMAILWLVGVVGRDGEFAGKPFAKPCHARAHEVLFRLATRSLATEAGTESAQVPLAEKAAGVTLLRKEFGEAELLLAEVSGIGGGDAVAEGVASGQAASPGRGTDGGACIKAGQANSGPGHVIKVWSDNLRMSIEPCITPAEVIRHAQDEIWCGGRIRERGRGQKGKQKQEKAVHDALVLRWQG